MYPLVYIWRLRVLWGHDSSKLLEESGAEMVLRHSDVQLAAERAKVALAIGALKPFADCVYNDNGNITVSYSRLSTGDWLRASRKFDALQSDARADVRKERE
jgi:hypothetical protein